MDDTSFYGGVLHVCYAPEYETVQETRSKLQERRWAVSRRLKQLGKLIILFTSIHVFACAYMCYVFVILVFALSCWREIVSR